MRKGLGARIPCAEWLAVEGYEEVRIIGRREAILFERRGRIGTCLDLMTRQDISLVRRLRARVERTDKNESCGEKTHSFFFRYTDRVCILQDGARGFYTRSSCRRPLIGADKSSSHTTIHI